MSEKPLKRENLIDPTNLNPVEGGRGALNPNTSEALKEDTEGNIIEPTNTQTSGGQAGSTAFRSLGGATHYVKTNTGVEPKIPAISNINDLNIPNTRSTEAGNTLHTTLTSQL